MFSLPWKVLVFFTLLLGSFSSYAQMNEAWNLLRNDRSTTKNYPQFVHLLVENELYYTSVPYIKEFLTRGNNRSTPAFDLLIDQVISKVGVRQFEVLPDRFLARSNAPSIQYVLAKKHFRAQKYEEALNALSSGIPRNHPVRPFALMLEGSIASIQGRYNQAISAFNECITLSNRRLNRTDSYYSRRQLLINRDNCVIGIPRTHFAAGNYDKATQSYLNLPKSSYIWPEILFEEAWSSFYQRDYNRTLGKLVTYKAPILDFVFNPEIEILNALTYMELCLWSDASKVIESFNEKYERAADQLNRYLAQHGKNYQHFYQLAQESAAGQKRGSDVFNTIMTSITRDPAFKELYESFQTGRVELEKINNISHQRFREILSENLRQSLLLQRDLIGAYVRQKLHIANDQLQRSLIGMSYIQLEVLSRRRTELYQVSDGQERSRGDISNVKRSSRQYFWTFNGEFWADELGDYVFSLKSECR